MSIVAKDLTVAFSSLTTHMVNVFHMCVCHTFFLVSSLISFSFPFLIVHQKAQKEFQFAKVINFDFHSNFQSTKFKSKQA